MTEGHERDAVTCCATHFSAGCIAKAFSCAGCVERFFAGNAGFRSPAAATGTANSHGSSSNANGVP